VDGRITASVEEINSLFARGYERTFATNLNRPVQIVSARASIRRPLPRRSETATAKSDPAAGEQRRCAAHSFTNGCSTSFTLVDRESLPIGRRVPGPLIINEPTCTSYVDADCSVERDSFGCLHVYCGGGKS
jgi:N-methylhydantoinase A